MHIRNIEFETSLDKNGLERLRVRLQTQKNELVDIVYQYESFIADNWVAIVRYDCSHGFFHKDVMYPNGTKEKTEIKLDSLKSASQYAAQDLKDRWEWYKERYLKKLKK